MKIKNDEKPKNSPQGSSWQDSPARKLIIFVELVAIVCIVISAIVYWYSTHGVNPVGSNPDLRVQVPTVAPTPISQDSASELNREAISSLFSWLSIEESVALRQQENVFNLAYLKNDGSTWYTTVTVLLSDENVEWQTPGSFEVGQAQFSAHPLEVGVSIQYKQHASVLNLHQPFILEDAPQWIFVADESGEFHRANTQDILDHLIAAEDAISTAPVNPNLGISY